MAARERYPVHAPLPFPHHHHYHRHYHPQQPYQHQLLPPQQIPQQLLYNHHHNQQQQQPQQQQQHQLFPALFQAGFVQDCSDSSARCWPLIGSAIRTDDAVSVSVSASASSSSSNNSVTSSISSSEMYFSREEIDRCSPSRRDGIDAQEECILRYSYCSFIQNLGMRLQLPQTTIATAMVLCHRFFLRRSHATFDRFVIATSCLFLAAKSEETPRPLDSMVLISYEMCNRQELMKYNFRMPNDWFEQFKERILDAEQLLLTALDFDLTVEHPYKPLMTVLNANGLGQTPLFHMSWNLLNDGLRSSLWLQFKPHHIAAGAVYLAARFLNIDLFSNGAPAWWQEFQTNSTILDNVVQQMLELYG